MTLEEKSRNSIALHRDVSRYLSRNRNILVAEAIEVGNVRMACHEYLEMQSEQLVARRGIESQLPIMREAARAKKAPSKVKAIQVLNVIRTIKKSQDLLIQELGKTIAAIRRAYAERSFDD